MPVYFDKTKGRWRYTFNRIVKAVRYRSTKLLPKGWSRAQAEAYDRGETTKLYAQATGIERPSPLIDTAVALYLEHRIPKLRNGLNAARELAHIVPWFEGRTFDDLAAVAVAYTKDNADLSPATIKNRLSYLRAACRHAWKAHGIGERGRMPGADMQLPTVENERDVYHSARELERLWRAFDDDEARDLFKLAMMTGLRWRSELLPRTQADILRDNGVWLVVPTTKNKRPRMVPIIPEALPLLKRLPFTRYSRTYYAKYERARRKAKLDGSVAHDLRHTLASAILSDGGTLSEVGAALGHKSVQSSNRYAHMYPARLRSVLETAGKKMKG